MGLRSCSVSQLLYIDYLEFWNIIKQFPNDYERFCELKENILVHNFKKGFDDKCYFCNLFNHSFMKCPLVNYHPDNSKICFNLRKTIDQDRLKVDRFSPRSQNIKVICKPIVDSIIEYLLDKNPFGEDEHLLL